MVMDPNGKAQIEAQTQAYVEALLFHKAPIEVPADHSKYTNIFSVENVTELPENTRINKHTITL